MKILKKLRRTNNITQDKLSEVLGVSRSTVSMWEIDASEPDLELVGKIANLFNVSTDYLLGRTDDPAPPGEKEKDTNPVSDNDIMFALFGGEKGITDDMLDDVREYAEFVKRRKMKQNENPQSLSDSGE